MPKGIKKILKLISIATASIAGLTIILYFALQTSGVQTFIVKRITNKISKEFKSTVQVGKVKFEFFDKLTLSDILIKDQHNDTLIFSETMITGISKLRIKEKSFKFGKVYLFKPVVALAKDSITDNINLKWYLEQLKSPEKEKKSVTITFDQIDLQDATFSLFDNKKSDIKDNINFNDLKLNNINATIELFKIENDTTSFNIRNLTLKEASGFSIEKLSSEMSITKGRIVFDDVKIICDSSVINMSYFELVGNPSDSSGTYSNFVENVRLRINLDNSLISSSDLMYFAPFAKQINEKIQLSGRISGTVAELRGRNIIASYMDNTQLSCDFDLSGLPNIKDAFIYIGVNKLTTDFKDIEKLPLNKKIELPANLYKMDKLSFDGSFTGFIDDFVAYGKINGSFGVITTDLSFRPVDKTNYIIKGGLNGSFSDLGQITGNSESFGKMSISSNIDGSASSIKSFSVNLTGGIDSIDIKNYTYKNISLNGLFTDKTWNGSISVDDENLKMDIHGLFNFEEELPEFDFKWHLTEANLFNLNLNEKDSTAAVNLFITSNFKGNSIDNLNGEIKLVDANYIKSGKRLELSDLVLNTFIEENEPALNLKSDFVDAGIKGIYNLGDFQNLFKYSVSKLMPLRYHSDIKLKDLKQNNFIFSINLKNTDEINSFFSTGIKISENSYIEGVINSDSLIMISGRAEKFIVYNNGFNDFSLNAVLKDSIFDLDITNSSLDILQQSPLDNFNMKLSVAQDNFIFKTEWGGKNKENNNGIFIANGKYFLETPDAKTATLKIDIEPSEIRSNSYLWKISESNIIIDTNAVKINKFLAENNEHFYSVNGIISENPYDTLSLDFKGINLEPVNYLTNRNKINPSDGLALDIKGNLNGNIVLTNLYKGALIHGDIIANDFSILGTNYGVLNIFSDVDVNEKIVIINANNNLNGEKNIIAEGYYDPPSKKLDLAINTNELSVNPLNQLLSTFASDISGKASGKVNLLVNPGDISLTGALMAENTSIKIDYLQTQYRINDSIRFDKRGINFNNVRLADERGNRGLLNGVLSHENFKNITPNLTINIDNCMVLNTRAKDNDYFYGSAFASGITTIRRGADDAITFNISASTDRNTRFYIPLNSSISASDVSFITFVDHTKHDSAVQVSYSAPQPASSGMNINMDLGVNPSAEVQLIFDPAVGDMIRVNGSGNININYNRREELRITGDYIIDMGSYLFTLGNFFNKTFSVQNGSRIIFNGDINDADIDLRAIYRLRASLDGIVPADMASSERVQVECHLNLTGKLFNPKIDLNIHLPTVDERTRAHLRSATATEEQMTTQFLYLLATNRFSDPNIGWGNSANAGTTGSAALSTTTLEMLSSQFNNMLSKISNDIDIGLAYRPGVSDITPDLFEIALSIPTFNDRVVINSNLDVRGTGANNNFNTNTNQITGDFDAEIKITEKIRFKVFNRYNNPYTGRQPDSYTQGIGVFFRQEFNKFSDFFKRKGKYDIKKEDEVIIEEEEISVSLHTN